MVGGLADWFAVEALFRHPLKIPIPHTALLPKNQKRAAGNIARFIDEYFLVPEQLLAQVQKLNPVRALARWLADRDNAKLVALEASHVLELVLKHQLQRGVGVGANRVIRDLLVDSVNPADLSTNIAALLKETAHSKLMDEVLKEVRTTLDQNRGRVTEIVQDRSRWWISSSVDKQIVKVLVDGILSIIDELADRDSKLRHDFDNSIVFMVETFHETGRITEFIEEGREQYMASPEFSSSVDKVIASVLTKIQKNVQEKPDQAADLISDAIAEFAQMLLDRQDLEEQLSDRLLAGMTTLLESIRPPIVVYITRVIEEWDSAELVDRMEREVGRDLQFIRINGAVLGAFVGGLLFVLTGSFH